MDTSSHIKLSELTLQIEQVIKDAFATKTYWVLAETSAVKYYKQKNYFYFDLVEKEENTNSLVTSIKSSAYGYAVNNIRNFEQATGQKFESNIQVLVKVGIEYTVKWGLKLTFLDIDHSFTIGNLEKQRQATLKKLIDENPQHIKLINGVYVTYNQKLELRPVIQNIALISSANAEGYNDFKKVLKDNQYKYQFFIDEFLTQVQGENASQQMVNSLITIFNSKKDYDAIVIVRGGGAPTDFIVFDSYLLSKAVARFPIPVITGIGHTGNLCVVDRMAYKSTISPTKAAETIILHNRNFEDKILTFQKSISSKTMQLLSVHQLRLNQINSIIISKSKDILSVNAQTLARINTVILTLTNTFLMQKKEQILPILHSISANSISLINDNFLELRMQYHTIKTSTVTYLNEKQYNLNYFSQLVKHISPANVLKRGYALVFQNNKIITDPNLIKNGSEITTLLHNTDIISIVKTINKSDESTFKL